MALDAGTMVVKLGLDSSKLDKGLNRVSGKLDQAAQKWGRRMKIAGGIMLAAVAAVGGASLKMAADFEKAMREVNTMMLLSEEAFAAFRGEVQALARDLGVNAVEAAQALYQAISAGVPKENVLEFLEVATKAAIGGVTDTATAVDGLTTIINAFKLPIEDAQHVADVMFQTVKGGKTTMDELSRSFFNVAPIAAAAGVDFEVVAAALATMTKQGVPTSVATTQLRQAIVAIVKPTKEMEDAIVALGYESGQTMVAELGLQKAFDQLRDTTEGSDQMLMKMFGSVEAGQAVLALTGQNAQMFSEDLIAIGEASEGIGAATEAFEQMEKSASRQLAKLKAKLQDVGISIGTALLPILVKLLERITPLIEKFGKWAAEHPRLVVVILASVAALGALLVVGGMLLPLLAKTIVSLHLVTAAQWAWNAAMTANPIGILIVAIGALVAGIIAISRNWESF